MSRRCGIPLLLARSRIVRSALSHSRYANTPNSAPLFPAFSNLFPHVFSKEEDQDCGGNSSRWESVDEKITNLEKLAQATKVTTCTRDFDWASDRQLKALHPRGPPRQNWNRSASPDVLQNCRWEPSDSSDSRSKLGGFGGFSGQSAGRFTSRSCVAGASNAVTNGFLSRSFSSAPAVIDGTQIAVDGENSLQASLAVVSDASSSAVGGLPSLGSQSEVALAAADCSTPTAFIQYVIDGVHTTTGLPWWASIVATTCAIRVLVLPIMIYQMKATARLTLMRPELEKLTNHIKESNYDPKVVEDNQARMKALFVKHKTTPFSPVLGAFVQAPLFMCFFFAIRNMAEKMESFKEGGTLWFTDLSTPDPLFIMPVLSGVFFLLTIELGATDGMQGQPMVGKMKMFLRGIAVLLVPLTASFPKALFCYWLTANVFSLIQAAVFKQPGVKAMVGIPDVSHLAKPADLPVVPAVTFSHPPRLKDGGKVSRTKEQRQ